MKQLHVLLVPLVLITSSYVFSVFVCVCVCVWCGGVCGVVVCVVWWCVWCVWYVCVCVCVGVWVCGCVHSCQQRVRSADGVNSDANSLASGASINEAATCITCAIGIPTKKSCDGFTRLTKSYHVLTRLRLFLASLIKAWLR